MHKNVSISKVVSNPFRHMDRYPINEEKIEELSQSMDRTGFWENVVARSNKGVYELAYGHHRWIAFKRKYGNKSEITLIIKNLSDEEMLKMMADENMQEFDNSGVVEETVRAVVLAYAEGKIELPRPPMNDGGLSSLRNAPSFLRAKGRFSSVKSLPKPYNAESIAKFLGWMQDSGQPQKRVRDALAILESKEEVDVENELEEIAKKGKKNKEIPLSQKREIADHIKREYREEIKRGTVPSKAKEKVVKETAKTVRDVVKNAEEKDTGVVRALRESLKRKSNRNRKDDQKSKKVYKVNELCEEVTNSIHRDLTESDERWNKLSLICSATDQVDRDKMKELNKALSGLAKRCNQWVEVGKGEKDVPKSSLRIVG